MNSGLTEIPSKFSKIRLKYGVERKSVKVDNPSQETPKISLDMVEPWTGKVNFGKEESNALTSGSIKFEPEDVLFNKLRPYLAKAFVAEFAGFGSSEFLVLRPQKFLPEYLQYLLTSPEFIYRVDASTYGTKMPRASWDFIGNIAVPCPSIQKQEAIVSALKKKTASIDRGIDTCETVQTVLTEKQESELEKLATTGDCAPDFEHCSELKVIDKIPGNWSIRRAKTLFTPRDERGFEQLPLLEVSLNHGVRRREENSNRTAWIAADLNNMKRVAKGDLVFNKMRLWQGAIGQSNCEGLVSPDYTILEPNTDANSHYYNYLIRTEVYKTEVNRRSYGLVDDRNRIYWKQFGDLPLLHPPLEVQERIVEKIQNLDRRIRDLQSNVESAIELLREKRQALITKAVTGQIDVTQTQSTGVETIPYE